MQQKDNLNQFGYGFQVKVLTSLITDRDFLIQSIDLLEPSYFESPPLKWLVEKTFAYFQEYKIAPTLDVFKIQLSNETALRVEIINSIKEIFKEVGSDDLPFIKTKLIEWAVDVKFRKSLETTVDLVSQGKLEEAKSFITDACKFQVVATDLGHNFIEDFEYRYTDQAEPERVATGFEVLDDVTGGGLPKGCLGVAIASTGGGKSWFLAKLGANALKAGKTVIHYTLELADIYTAKRYDSLLSSIPFDDLKYHHDQIDKVISKLTGKLFIKEYPPSTLSLLGLEAHIEKYIMLGHKPDLVIIDYPELLKINYTGERDDKVLGQLYTDIRGLAGRFNFTCWVVDQTNRCLKFDTKVNILNKGEVEIENVTVGDLILTHEGFKPIVHVFDPEIQPVYRIKLKNGKIIECSAKHEFPVQYGKLKSIQSGLSVGDKLFIKK